MRLNNGNINVDACHLVSICGLFWVSSSGTENYMCHLLTEAPVPLTQSATKARLQKRHVIWHRRQRAGLRGTTCTNWNLLCSFLWVLIGTESVVSMNAVNFVGSPAFWEISVPLFLQQKEETLPESRLTSLSSQVLNKYHILYKYQECNILSFINGWYIHCLSWFLS